MRSLWSCHCAVGLSGYLTLQFPFHCILCTRSLQKCHNNLLHEQEWGHKWRLWCHIEVSTKSPPFEVENCSGQLATAPNGCINLFTQPEPILNQEVLKWESFTFGERRTISLIHLPSREQRDISVPNATLNFRQAHRICGTNFRTFISMSLSYDIYF